MCLETFSLSRNCPELSVSLVLFGPPGSRQGSRREENPQPSGCIGTSFSVAPCGLYQERQAGAPATQEYRVPPPPRGLPGGWHPGGTWVCSLQPY